MKIDIENTHISADMLRVYQDLKDKDPVWAGEALAVHDAYSGKNRRSKMLNIIKKLFERKKFKQDLTRCINKVISGYPGLSTTGFRVDVNPLYFDIIFNVDFYFDSKRLKVYKPICICGLLGMKVLDDDSKKEAVLAHEFSEVSYILKTDRATRRRWYDEDGEPKDTRYDDLFQRIMDLSAARRGYGPGLIKAFKSLRDEIHDDKELSEDLADRIRRLGAYLKRNLKYESVTNS